MKRTVMIFSLILGIVGGAAAQIADPTPIPPSRRAGSESERINQAISDDADMRFRQLQDLQIKRTRDTDGKILNENILFIYREPNKEDLKIIAPSRSLVERYADFLRQSETGIIKLNADDRCGGENNLVVAASENCRQYKMPGAGTAFSFRTESYRIPRLSDLILSKNILKTDGVLQHGIMVNLGDVPLETVTPKTKGLKFLSDFQPAKTEAEFLKINGELSAGIKADGFVYRLGFYVSDKATFALRSIAYKGTFLRSANGVTYDEFNFDKRKDTIIVFRVVEQDANGNVTLLWKIMSKRDAPSLKLKK